MADFDPALIDMRRPIERARSISVPLVVVVAIIGGIGVAALYSVAGGAMEPWAAAHLGRLTLGIALALALSLVALRFWMGLSYLAYATVVVLLGVVLFQGALVAGARRWLDLGAFTFQPSELMKIVLVLALARFYQALPPRRLSHPIGVAVPVLMILVPAILVARQPDLGTALILVAVGLAMMMLAGVNLLYFGAALAAVAVAAPQLWQQLHDYQRLRIMVFLEPEIDPLGAGYQVFQSRVALGSGGATGKGFLEGSQTQLDFVPEKHTDFIAALIGEEFGLIGTAALLVLFAVLALVLLAMAIRCRNHFGRLLIGGVGLTVFLQAAVNLAMVMGLLPVVGVPLPLVSYGGTSLFTTMIALGLAMSAYVDRKTEFRREDMNPGL